VAVSRYGGRLVLCAAALVGLASFAPPPAQVAPAEVCRFELGTNLDGASYWSSGLPYLDLTRQAGHWLVQGDGSWDTGEPVEVDARGFPTFIPFDRSLGLIITREVTPPLRQAEYRVRYDGTAEIKGMLGTVVAKGEQPGEYRALSADDGSLHFSFGRTAGGSAVRSLQVVRADRAEALDRGQSFNPEWLPHLRPFSSLRFMDWMNTNGLFGPDGEAVKWVEGHGFDVAERPLRWVDRPRPDDVRWNRGVPVEVMVALVNELGADPWFNMPINATDDYVRGFATYVRRHIHPRATIRVELSNEVWNGIFPQSAYARARAREMWGEEADGLEWYGRRTAEIGRIWNEVFDEPERGPAGRVRIVYGTQFAWKGRESAGLETRRWRDADGEHVRAADFFDEYAITGYYDAEFGSEERSGQLKGWWSQPDGGYARALEELRRYIDERNAPLYRYHSAAARRYGLNLVTYESGYGEAPPVRLRDDKAFVDFLIELQRRPEIEELELRNAKAFRDAGGCLFSNFGLVGAPGRYGSWSALEHVGQATSPRYRALLKLAGEARRTSAPQSSETDTHGAAALQRGKNSR
jgi:hypothetical protein